MDLVSSLGARMFNSQHDVCGGMIWTMVVLTGELIQPDLCDVAWFQNPSCCANSKCLLSSTMQSASS